MGVNDVPVLPAADARVILTLAGTSLTVVCGNDILILFRRIETLDGGNISIHVSSVLIVECAVALTVTRYCAIVICNLLGCGARFRLSQPLSLIPHQQGT
jgi:hypothetical protein